MHFIPEILVKGRVHAKQVSRSAGFSYHNPEQDMFWQRSLEWLETSSDPAKDYDVFYAFGKNAYKKTRYEEGKKAFKIAGRIMPSKKPELFITASVTRIKAFAWAVLKKLYMVIKM